MRGLLIDLDGVVYEGQRPIPGAANFLAAARQHGLPFLLVTNNSTASPETVAERLSRMSISAQPSEILTSADAAAGYVQSNSNGSARVLVVGEAGLSEAVTRRGLELVEAAAAESAEWVLVGLDRSFDYARLTAGVSALRAGARFVATNADALLPVEGGRFLPGAGTMVAAIGKGASAEPTVIGKPEPILYQQGCAKLGSLPPESVAMIGDRMDTDIEGGHRAGLRTILVLTGVSTREDAQKATVLPDVIVQDLASVASVLGW